MSFFKFRHTNPETRDEISKIQDVSIQYYSQYKEFVKRLISILSNIILKLFIFRYYSLRFSIAPDSSSISDQLFPLSGSDEAGLIRAHTGGHRATKAGQSSQIRRSTIMGYPTF